MPADRAPRATRSLNRRELISLTGATAALAAAAGARAAVTPAGAASPKTPGRIVQPGEPVIYKPRYSGFYETELDEKLQALSARYGDYRLYDGVCAWNPRYVMRCSGTTRPFYWRTVRRNPSATGCRAAITKRP